MSGPHLSAGDRLPMIGGGGLQFQNDPNNFEFSNNNPQFPNNQFPRDDINGDRDPFENNDYQFGNESQPFNQSPNKNDSPSKTGGQVTLRDLQQDDISKEPYIGRDAVVIIEGNMRQFDNKKSQKVQKYVESLVTGTFMSLQKDINLQLQTVDQEHKAKKIQSNREFVEKEMKETQKLWVNRINKLFNLFLGLLAGMSLMHLISILSQNDKSTFLTLYSPISILISVVFLVFASFGFILSLALTMIFKQKSDEKMRNMDIFRVEFKQYYIVSLTSTILLGICLTLMYVIPRFSNIIYYRSPSSISDSDILIFKALFSAINVLFIVDWLLASAFNKASITDMDLDPEDLELEIELDQL